MNIVAFGKKGVWLGLYALFLAVILVPVQVDETIPVPVSKPALMASGARVPVPARKPMIGEVIKPHVIQTAEFEAMSLNLANLLPVSLLEEDETVKSHAHGYMSLSAKQAKLYQKIFETQNAGHWDLADDLIRDVRDDRLMGYVLSQRYLHSDYQSRFAELKGWMDVYADYPQAGKVYDLARKYQESSGEEIPQAKKARILSQTREPMIAYPKYHVSALPRSAQQGQAYKSFTREISTFIRKGQVDEALSFFRNESDVRTFIDEVEHDQIQAQIASGFLYRGRLSEALQLAQPSAMRSSTRVPQASWVAGLALWQKKDYTNAAKYFDNTAKSSYASGWLASAGAYWAARCYERSGQKSAQIASLQKAARHSRTFYGLLAAKSLGQSVSFNWNMPEYTQDHEAFILSSDAGKRAYSLVAAQQYDLAEEELLRLDYKGNKALRQAVLAYASRVGLPGISLRLGNMVKDGQGQYYDSAIYPVTAWEPEDGYRLDPALVHAVIRQESRFNLQAKSYSGALGLMQLMPKTAEYISQKNGYESGLDQKQLRRPEVNMKIGQDYLEYLLDMNMIDGDVISMLVSYNAGPGNLQKWRKRLGDKAHDPLLFIETLPVSETRDYVERVLSNYWIYRLRAGLDVPGLAALSRGQSYRYAHVMQAEYPYQLASNH
ncbi:MAG: transglycosylase SLT domain-containing protein [Alphaproteobacteria bacterium]